MLLIFLIAVGVCISVVGILYKRNPDRIREFGKSIREKSIKASQRVKESSATENNIKIPPNTRKADMIIERLQKK